jgi:hypothetical protein
MTDEKYQYPCGGFVELQQLPPGQSTTEQYHCIFNDIQKTQYICPMQDEYPILCQESFRELNRQIISINADLDAALAKQEKLRAAEEKASTGLKSKIAGIFRKDGEEEPTKEIQPDSV